MQVTQDPEAVCRPTCPMQHTVPIVQSPVSPMDAMVSSGGRECHIPFCPPPVYSDHLCVLRSLYFTPILFAIPRDRTPNLTTITVTTNHYTPYPMQRHQSRLLHSLMAVRLMFASCQDPSSCISHSLASRRLMYFISTLWPLSASCLSHVCLTDSSWLALVL